MPAFYPVEALLVRAERHARRVAAERPDIRSALELQQRFIASMIRATEGLARVGFTGLDLPPARQAEKLAAREPLLQGEAIALPVPLLATLLRELAVGLSEGGAVAADKVIEALDARRIDPGAWLAASLGRDQRAIAGGGTQMGLAPDLLWLIGEMASAPAAHLLHQRFSGAADLSRIWVRALPDGWGPGYCPTCGSWPALAETGPAGRVLRCSFCAGAWLADRQACIYCGAEDGSFATEAPDEDAPGRRVEFCVRCGGYLKSIDVEDGAPFPLVALADLETIDLDQAAADRGFVRPALPEFPARRPGCPG